MIPTSFKLVNRTVKVKKLGKSLADDLGRDGDYSRSEGLIRVCFNGPDDHNIHTYFHELAHALLEASPKPDLSKDEEFVDCLGALLHQYEQTKRGELE